MKHVSYALAGILMIAGAAAAQTPSPSQPPQKPTPTQTEKAQPPDRSQPSQQAGERVTLTGCLRQTSDDPKTFALVDAKPGANMTGASDQVSRAGGTAGQAGQMSAGRAPFYRLQDSGTPDLKTHVNKRVEVTGMVTMAKDEKGADIVSISKEQTIGLTTTTIRAVDLKPAPMLNVTSVKATGDCPAAKQ